MISKRRWFDSESSVVMLEVTWFTTSALVPELRRQPEARERQ